MRDSNTRTTNYEFVALPTELMALISIGLRLLLSSLSDIGGASTCAGISS